MENILKGYSFENAKEAYTADGKPVEAKNVYRDEEGRGGSTRYFVDIITADKKPAFRKVTELSNAQVTVLHNPRIGYVHIYN